MVAKKDEIVVGVLIKVLRKTEVPERYKTMFHGKTELDPGTFVWWYPVKNVTYARLVHEIERWYGSDIKIQYGVAGSMEV